VGLCSIGAELEDVIEVKRYVRSVVTGPNKESVGDVPGGGAGDSNGNGEPALDVGDEQVTLVVAGGGEAALVHVRCQVARDTLAGGHFLVADVKGGFPSVRQAGSDALATITEVVMLPLHRGVHPDFVATAGHDSVDGAVSKAAVQQVLETLRFLDTMEADWIDAWASCCSRWF
jgi:hypothetical protein